MSLGPSNANRVWKVSRRGNPDALRRMPAGHVVLGLRWRVRNVLAAQDRHRSCGRAGWQPVHRRRRRFAGAQGRGTDWDHHHRRRQRHVRVLARGRRPGDRRAAGSPRIAVAPDGTLFVADSSNANVRRVSPDGVIRLFAGTGGCCRGSREKGGPAAQRSSRVSRMLRWDRTEASTSRRTRAPWAVSAGVSPAGIITTVVGGATGPLTTGSPRRKAPRPPCWRWQPDPTAASMWLRGIRACAGWAPTASSGRRRATATQASTETAVPRSPRGSRARNPSLSARTARCSSATRRTTACGAWRPRFPPIPPERSPSPRKTARRSTSSTWPGSTSARGRRSELGSLRVLLRRVGRLASIRDGDLNVTTIERNGSGVLTGIRAPFGQLTSLQTDAAGFLSRITDPANGLHQLGRSRTGPHHLHRPNGKQSSYTYEPDGSGRLALDSDPAGGWKSLARTATPDGHRVDVTTRLGRTTKYLAERLGRQAPPGGHRFSGPRDAAGPRGDPARAQSEHRPDRPADRVHDD